MNDLNMRFALITQKVDIAIIRRYLPSNYTAAHTPDMDILIFGEDSHGWTMDGYVIPRLNSGNYYPKEL